MKSLYNPPKILKKLFSDFYWTSAADKILLTFDDGPVAGNAERILQELQKYSAKAVFFFVGNNITKNPSLAKEIINEGHTIANHTYNHKKVNSLSKAERLEEIKQCTDVIEQKLSHKVKYFRPPHGKFNFGLAKELAPMNLKTVMWSLLTYDYKADLNLVKKSAQNYLESNSIVVLHDNLKSKDIIIDAINIIFEEAEKKNYSIGNPDECLK